MIRNLAIPLLCAVTIFALGAGYEPVSSARADDAGRDARIALDERITVLPTVVVRPDPRDVAIAARDEGSVVLDDAVEAAGSALAAQVGAGVRRVSLAVPYYAFGGVAPRGSE